MNGFLSLAVILTVFSVIDLSQSAAFTKCELAKRLKLHGADNVAEWTCLAEVYTNGRFDPNWKNPSNGGYGLWEINSRDWCKAKDGSNPNGLNRCGFDCDRFTDTFLTDDIRCLKLIHGEKGFYGFPAWFRRFKACGNLATYLNDCPL